MKKNENKNKNNYMWIGILVVILLVVGLFFVINITDKDEKEDTSNVYEAQQYESFVKDMSDYAGTVDTGMDYDTAKSELISQIIDKQKAYKDGNGVGYASNLLVNTISSDTSNNTGSLLQTLSSALEKLLGSSFPSDSSTITNTLTIKSNTVCNDGDIDAKYCIEKLSAKVYVVDKSSDKWAILLHGNMMTGKQMYSAIGDMYTKQGYNVLALDLRGAGDSDGSVAMGYLESLDVYDWLKDLNANWESRYGVLNAPKTIVVHGVSLGGATTLQLATNPDIANASGKGPYTKNLTQLGVKGFVDDCGYTSMNSIIKGLLSIGDSSQISGLLGSFNIDKIDFISELKKQSEDLDIAGLKDVDISGLVSGNDKNYMKYFDQFNEQFNKVSTEIQKYEQSGGTYEIPGVDVDSIRDQLSGFLPTSASSNEYGATKINNNLNLNLNDSNILDGLIAKVLIAVGNVGLNDNNYEKYSNVFSEGRSFPSGSKVLIIHGTADTMVPFENSNVVAQHISPAKLLYKWDAEGMPHAFIVVGSKKSEYSSLVGDFANCVTNSSCTSIQR